ncbi:hypothetical protein F5887DRAFT_916043 [Amanita rubescens]|nr:hypothetical protein F5887DRAFT_916043 [Amanita rubescens]
MAAPRYTDKRRSRLWTSSVTIDGTSYGDGMGSRWLLGRAYANASMKLSNQDQFRKRRVLVSCRSFSITGARVENEYSLVERVVGIKLVNCGRRETPSQHQLEQGKASELMSHSDPTSQWQGCPLEFSSKEGQGYFDDKGEVGKLRTARGKKTNQILGPCQAKVPLALSAREMTYHDNELAMVLPSGSKNLDDRIQDQRLA